MTSIHLRCPDCDHIDVVSLSCPKHGKPREVGEIKSLRADVEDLQENMKALRDQRDKWARECAEALKRERYYELHNERYREALRVIAVQTLDPAVARGLAVEALEERFDP